jgi:hypothetical protein
MEWRTREVLVVMAAAFAVIIGIGAALMIIIGLGK